MKKAALILFVFIAIFILSLSAFCEEFPVQELSPYSGVEGLSSTNNTLSFRSTSPMPLLMTKDNIFINASRFKVMEIRMKSDKSYMTGRIFFRRIGDPGFGYNNSFEFQTGLNNMYHTYIVDLSRNPNWFGTVTQAMLSPINSEGSVEIERIGFLEPSIWLTARAFWQEFFTFEVPQMRTVNFIYGPKINSAPIYYYIYYLILALSVFVIVREFIEAKDLGTAISKSSSKILMICLFFWIVLDMRLLFDQARTAVLDAQVYDRKGLEEKRAITTLGDFYDFIAFCNSRIPQGSSFNIISPTYYYFREKAVYYLYPTHLEDKAEYIIVYNPNGDLDGNINDNMKNGYRVFSIRKEGGIILKK